MAPKYDNPQYRTHRTQPAQRVTRSKEGSLSRWVDSLRGFRGTTPVDGETHPSPYARRDASPGKTPRKRDMDFGAVPHRHDANPRTDAYEQDWGRCIRLADSAFKDRPEGAHVLNEEENTRQFAETFLSLRAAATRGRDLLL